MNIFEKIREVLLAPIIISGQKLPFSLWEFLWTYILPLLLFFVLYKLMFAALRRFIARFPVTTRFTQERRESVLRWSRIVLRVFYGIVVLIFTAKLLGAETFKFLNYLYLFLNEPFFTSGSTRISVVTLLLMIPVFYLASWASRAARLFFERSLLSRLALDDARRFSAASLIRYTIMALIVLLGLSIVGIDLSSLTLIFGFLGIGLGFGLQSVVANFFAGMVIILARPIKEGDRILVNNYEGNVGNIRLLSSIINTLTNETIIVPNSQIINNYIHNYSYADRRIIIINRVQVAYSSDLDLVVEVLEKVGNASPYTIPDRKAETRIESFENSGIQLALWTWIKDVSDKNGALSWINLEIWRQFKKQGIEIPFPQVDLHVKSD